jgi:hypothetical protein
MAVAYTYDYGGQVASVKYPGASTPYVYTSDGMGRHVSLSKTEIWGCGDIVTTPNVVQNVQIGLGWGG